MCSGARTPTGSVLISLSVFAGGAQAGGGDKDPPKYKSYTVKVATNSNDSVPKSRVGVCVRTSVPKSMVPICLIRVKTC